MDLDEHREQLIARARACDGVTSLVFFGSATTAEQGRRDVWSDLDVRTHALCCLCWAIRGRLAPAVSQAPSAFDPTRRLESAYPQLGGPIVAAVGRPAEDAARLLFDIAREELEPSWAQIPTAAADLVAARLGWV